MFLWGFSWFRSVLWFSQGRAQGWDGQGKGRRSVLRKEMSYCFSLDRYVERLKDNSNDY